MKNYSLKLEFDQLPKSLNVKLRANKWGRYREDNAWDMIVACAVAMEPKPAKPLTKAVFSAVRHSHRTLDYDGLVGSLKPVVDALVSCGVLVDDSWKVLGQWNVSQKFRSKNEGPLLEVWLQENPLEKE